MRRQGDAGRLKNPPDLAFDVGASGDPLAVLLDGSLLQPVEVADQVGPLDDDALGAAQAVQLLLQHQGRKEQKTWPRMAASEEW